MNHITRFLPRIILLVFGIIFFACQSGSEKNKEKSIIDKSWKISSLQSLSGEPSIRGMHVVSDSVVWVSGSKGTIALTTDGGQEWQQFHIPGTDSMEFRDIHAFSDSSAIAINAGSPAMFYKTVDMGKNWRLVYTNDHPNVFFDAMDFWDDHVGLVFSDPIENHLFILKTIDGGESWNEISSENIPETVNGEAGFAASGTCLEVADDSLAWIGTGGNAARIFYSHDSGEHWEVYDTPVLQGDASTGIFSVNYLHETGSLIAVGGNYAVDTLSAQNSAISLDQGQSWKNLDGIGPGGYRSCVILFNINNEQFGFACGTSGIDISTDAGRHWEPFDSTGYHVCGIAKGGNLVYLAGSKGRISRLER